MKEDAKEFSTPMYPLATSLIRRLNTIMENKEISYDDGATGNVQPESILEIKKPRRKRQIELELDVKWSSEETIKFYFEDEAYTFSKLKIFTGQSLPVSYGNRMSAVLIVGY